jgi:DNA repair exonuclease SbcCD ATPase subunit
MGDTVFSAKIDEDLKAKFEELAQSAGTTQKDFFGRLITAYETNQVRESMAQVKEIEQLSHHLARIQEIYIGLIKSSQDQQDADISRIAQTEDEATRFKALAMDTQEQLQSVTDQASAEVETARADAALARETAAKEVQDAKEALDRARDAQEQSAKLATLAEEAATAAKAKAVDMEARAGQADQYRQEAEQARQESRDLARQLEQAQESLRSMQENSKTALVAQAAKMDDALQRAAERAEVEKDKAVLAAQRESMNETNTLREALSKVREEKAELEILLVRAGVHRADPGQTLEKKGGPGAGRTTKSV